MFHGVGEVEAWVIEHGAGIAGRSGHLLAMRITPQGVLDARTLHPERSLADHYNPLVMDPAPRDPVPELLQGHERSGELSIQ